jgi:hypothetical protein
VHANTLQLDSNADTRASIAIATLLLALGLAGCAAELRGGPDSSAAEGTSYVGVFTGEYVDGKPLYRFPRIIVFGSRSSVDGI